MKKKTGTVIATRTKSSLNKDKQVIEIEIDEVDDKLLLWQNQRLSITIE